jgi:hypothetical protein
MLDLRLLPRQGQDRTSSRCGSNVGFDDVLLGIDDISENNLRIDDVIVRIDDVIVFQA